MKIRSLAGIVFVVACGGAGVSGVAVEPATEYSPIKYFGTSLVSLNDKCPNTGQPLSSDIEPLYVNGRPIGFC